MMKYLTVKELIEEIQKVCQQLYQAGESQIVKIMEGYIPEIENEDTCEKAVREFKHQCADYKGFHDYLTSFIPQKEYDDIIIKLHAVSKYTLNLLIKKRTTKESEK